MSETRLVRHRAPATAALSAIALAAFGALSDTSERGTTSGRVIVVQNNTGDKSGTAADKKEKFEAAKKAKMEAAKKEKLEAAKKEKAAAKLDEEALAARKAAAKAAKARAAKSDDDDGDDAKGKGKKQCPPGRTPAPSRGRGGDAGGCI